MFTARLVFDTAASYRFSVYNSTRSPIKFLEERRLAWLVVSCPFFCALRNLATLIFYPPPRRTYTDCVAVESQNRGPEEQLTSSRSQNGGLQGLGDLKFFSISCVLCMTDPFVTSTYAIGSVNFRGQTIPLEALAALRTREHASMFLSRNSNSFSSSDLCLRLFTRRMVHALGYKPAH